jgi:DNA-binding SARP family transcriptional activator
LADSLWPDGDPERNRHNLNTTLWRLRSLLEPERRETYLLSYPGGYLGFNRGADYFCDVEELEAALNEVRAPGIGYPNEAQLNRLRTAAELYRGELLEGLMSEWVLPHRDRLARVHQDSLLILMKAASARDDIDESVYWAERILEQDPLREDVHRALIEAYDKSGQRVLALRQYDRVRHILEEELNTRPSRETEALYYRVIEPVPESEDDSRDPRSDLGEVVHLLAAIERRLAEGMSLLARHLGSSQP